LRRAAFRRLNNQTLIEKFASGARHWDVRALAIIHLRDKSKIAELEKLLRVHGDDEIAYIYFRSGEPRLRAAAESWFALQGQTIKEFGSPYVRPW